MENRRILVDSVSIELIRYEPMILFEDRAKGFSEQDFIEALSEIPVAPPADIDNLTA